MDNDVDVVVLACLGTLADWSGAIESVVYELARANGESPMDRGAALRRRVERLSREAAGGPCLASAFERLARERGWRRRTGGHGCRQRVVALSRPFPDVAPALELVAGAAGSLVVLSQADRALVEGALRPLDGAFDAIVTAADIGGPASPGVTLARVAGCLATPPDRILHVSASRAAVDGARVLGMRRAWVNRDAADGRPRQLRPDEEWKTLHGLAEFFGVASGPLPVAG
jgi:FMN phosphatase YigB (HAD superfamily)